MKVLCDREALNEAFKIASSVAPSRSPKPILQSVKMEATDAGVVLKATDLEIGVSVDVAGVEVEQQGSAVLPVDRVGRILSESSDAKLYIEAGDSGTVVRGERSEFNLPSGNPDEFPSIASFDAEQYHKLSPAVLRGLLHRTEFATDPESTRYALGGVLLEMDGEQVTAVGTDGRRLAMMQGPAAAVGGHSTADRQTIVPTKAVRLIERAFSHDEDDVLISARSNDVLVKGKQATIYARLVEGRFPRWRDVFPSSDGAQKIEMIVGPTHAAVRQAAIVTSEDSRGVDCTFAAGQLMLAGRTAEKGQSRVELPISYDGPEIVITLDPRFMSDFLRVLDPETNFTLIIRDSASAALCTTDDGYSYVIMPLARDKR